MIRAFGADDPELTLSDVARRTGLTRAAARRFLLTLADLGYVRTDGKQFALTPRVLELGYAYLSSLTLPEVAEPHLERLAAEVRESSLGLGARRRRDRLRRPRPDQPHHARLDQRRHPLPRLRDLDGPRAARRARPTTSSTPTSTRAEIRPLTARAIDNAGGAARGARPRSARRAGRSSTRSSRRACARSPRRSATRGGRVVAAVNVSAHASRAIAEDVRQTLLPPLLATAQRIEADLRTSRRRRPDAYHR